MRKSKARPPIRLCLKADCRDHAGDASWLHPPRRPRPVYAAARRGGEAA